MPPNAFRYTGRVDTSRKRRIYAEIGIPEYWRFDPTGGDYHGQALAGERLVDGIYQPIELTTDPDGILKGHSEALGVSLCWDDGRPRLYDPAVGEYLRSVTEEHILLERSEAALEAERAENRRLREQLRRLESGER